MGFCPDAAEEAERMKLSSSNMKWMNALIDILAHVAHLANKVGRVLILTVIMPAVLVLLARMRAR